MRGGMYRQTGIVLRTYTNKHTIALLDAKLGRIDGVVYKLGIAHGSLLTYQATCRGRHYLLQDIALLDMPLFVARTDILFLHHVLELCFASIPVGSFEPDIFTLLCQLYDGNTPVTDRIYKKLFLFKILTVLSIHPTHNSMPHRDFQYLMQTPIDRIGKEHIELECEKRLDEWLCMCVAEHPAATSFKTMHFLTDHKI